MTDFYLRRWRITLGQYESEDLDCTFKIVRTLRTTTPGTCELELYNLTRDHAAVVQGAGRRAVRVEAGYRDSGLSLLFQGDTRRVDTRREGPDWVTKATAGDGAHAIRTARAARSFGPQTTLVEVVRALADALGVGVGNAGEAIAGAALDRLDSIFPRGTVVRGPVAAELTRLLGSAGLSWSVQDGVLQVLPRGGALNRQAVVLGPDSGLVDSPERGQHGVIKATSLLNGDLVPGRLVLLNSEVISGVHRIQKAEYEGDTRADAWHAHLELRAVA